MFLMDKKHKNKSVLIGSSGTGSAFSTILALRRNWGSSLKIVAMDTNPGHLVTSSLLSDKFFQVPESVNPEFKNVIILILSDEDIDTYIPFIDDEISIAASLYEEGTMKDKLVLQVRSIEIAEICNDKFKTFLWLKENNILTPECFSVDKLTNNYNRYVLKPRKGFGSQIINLEKCKEKLSEINSDDFIVQYECDKPEITIDVCFDKKGNRLYYVCRERIETKSGVCTKARLFYDEVLENIAYKIADRLNLCAFCFQVMRYKGEWAVTDVNARLGAGTAMSYAAGMDFFSGMFAILWDEDPSEYFRLLGKETFITRQYNDFLM
jgi:carbamoylphosphate synthase large subunit